MFLKNYELSLSGNHPFKESLDCSLKNCTCRFNNFSWISHKKKIIYFETPKCGCTSIKKAFDISLDLECLIFAFALRKSNTTHNLAFERLGLSAASFKCNDRLFKSKFTSVLEKIRTGNLETDPKGRWGFSHSFDTPDNLIDKHPSYSKFIIIRNPFERFISAFKMYADHSNLFRFWQIYSSSEEYPFSAEKLEDKVDLFLRARNHHIAPLDEYFPLFGLENGVEVVDLGRLNDFLRLKFGADVRHDNTGYRKVLSRSLLSDSIQNKLNSFYQHELKLIGVLS